MPGRTPPSHFAQLLRQSKFASYDPSIAQVYTTFGGHAHRGDWGLKRPLPNRRRNGMAIIQAVDTKEQQTEWRSAEPEGRWIRKWQEMSPRVMVEDMGDWSERSGQARWNIDSDFSTFSRREVDTTVASVPNTRAMSPKQFDSYVESLRVMRPQFRQYLQEEQNKRPDESLNPDTLFSKPTNRKSNADPLFAPESTPEPRTTAPPVNLYALAQDRHSTHHAAFLTQDAQSKLSNPDSTSINPCPHPLGGLSYSNPSHLQAYLQTQPVPGRILSNQAKTMTGRKNNLFYVAGVGGNTARLEIGDAPGKTTLDWGRASGEGRTDVEAGRANFRVSDAMLGSAPNAVLKDGQKDGLDSTVVQLHVQSVDHEDTLRSNSERPGSRSYVGLKGSPPPGTRQPSATFTEWVGNPGGYGQNVPKVDPHELIKTLRETLARGSKPKQPEGTDLE